MGVAKSVVKGISVVGKRLTVHFVEHSCPICGQLIPESSVSYWFDDEAKVEELARKWGGLP